MLQVHPDLVCAPRERAALNHTSEPICCPAQQAELGDGPLGLLGQVRGKAGWEGAACVQVKVN